MIEARGLTKYYGPFVAIRNLSFEILPGQIVALLGPNGAGKSTTMKILTGFIAASEGVARIAGFDVRADRTAALTRLGYLPENGPAYSDMTPRQWLEFLAEARGMPGERRCERIAAVIERCELAPIAEKPIGQLSKGLRQRVGLAQVLLHDPEVLILDEPTAGLDPNQIRRFRSHIRDLGRDKTVLISTHILQEVEAVADRVLLLHNGRLVFNGTPDELKENGSLEVPFERLTANDAAGSGAAGVVDRRAAE